MAGTTHAVWTRKDLVGIADLTREEIEMVLDAAPQFGACPSAPAASVGAAALQGRLVVLWFHEPSTRAPVLL
jgi:aspartate carbamoyltransferase catalytic subunit